MYMNSMMYTGVRIIPAYTHAMYYIPSTCIIIVGIQQSIALPDFVFVGMHFLNSHKKYNI